MECQGLMPGHLEGQMAATLNVTRIVESLKRFLTKNGIAVESTHRAQTGSVYLQVAGKKIRVADHQDAHGTADYTVDGLEGTLEGCKTWALETFEQDMEWVAEQQEASRGKRERARLEKIFWNAWEEASKSGKSPVECESAARAAVERAKK